MAALAPLHLWPLRALWLAVALASAPVVGDALAERSTPVVAVATVVAWAGWTVALAAMLVPRTSSLTVVRLVVPTALGATLAAVATVADTGADTTPVAIAAVVATSLAVVVVLAPWTVDAFVDGSSYGPERRIPLRTPPAIAALAVVAWALAVLGALAGPLLLATGRWAPGVVATVAGGAVAALAVRSIHQLSQRWLVLVPTGMVLHDPITMPEAQLFLRQTMRLVGPATLDEPEPRPEPRPEGDPDDDHDGTDPELDVLQDLTGGASGLAMELVLDEPVALLVNDGAREASVRSVDRVLFTPLLPATFLAAARDHRLPVG